MLLVGRDGDWFRLHDAGGGSSFEGAVALAAACVDVDVRRELYGLPISVPPEQRLTRSQTPLSPVSKLGPPAAVVWYEWSFFRLRLLEADRLAARLRCSHSEVILSLCITGIQCR